MLTNFIFSEKNIWTVWLIDSLLELLLPVYCPLWTQLYDLLFEIIGKQNNENKVLTNKNKELAINFVLKINVFLYHSIRLKKYLMYSFQYLQEKSSFLALVARWWWPVKNLTKFLPFTPIRQNYFTIVCKVFRNIICHKKWQPKGVH